tara:strand:+ start:59 stop:619 length:561 start_codon:yes stop_codon:yes gene_type:complete
MRKVRVDDCICHGKLVDHDRVRNIILDKIENDLHIETVGKNSFTDRNPPYPTNDKISKLDWTKANDFKRPWVKVFKPNFDITINNFISDLGYYKFNVDKMWYQQYSKEDEHQWHIHGGHYTGVYYLEFPKGSGKTELRSPFNFKTHVVNAKEGDIIMFPAHWIHRGSPNGQYRKTIVSFNFDLEVG